MSSVPAPAVPGVTFEVERFEWASDDRLEVVGRWFGLRGHRFLRPTLDVEVRGERRRMLALLEHKPWAAEEGEEWVAAFDWRGERATLDDAELTVSPDLAVQLPLPDAAEDDAPAAQAVASAERRPARRPRTAVLEDELAAAVAEVRRRDEELAQVRESHSEASRELRERARVAQESAKRLESELEEARDALAAAQAEARESVTAARTDAEQELDRLREERDAAVAERDRAGAEAADARAEREAAVKNLAAAEGERDALVEARDRARQERNAWMSRARAAASEARGGRPIADRVPAPIAPAAEPAEPAAKAAEPAAKAAEPAAKAAEPAAKAAEPAASPEPEAASPPEAAAPAAERRTIQIGERPGPLRTAPPPHGSLRPLRETWTPRLVALVALAAVVLVVILLLLFAF